MKGASPETWEEGDGIEVPQDKVERKKAEVLAMLRIRGLVGEVYDQTIRLINSYAGLTAAGVVDEVRCLRKRLNLLIRWGHRLHFAAGVAVIVAGMRWSYWPLLVALGLELAWYLLISPRQTATNVEIAATTNAFWEAGGMPTLAWA